MTEAHPAQTAGEPDRWPSRPLLLVMLTFTMARVLVALLAGISEDEAYYRLWGLAPAAGYVDHPPAVAWAIAAGRMLFGDSPLGIRLAAVLTPLIGGLALWRTAILLFDRATADLSALVLLAMPLIAAGGVIITPDTTSVLFWGLALWALAELQHSGRGVWWLLVGLFAGLGVISKYTNLFLGAGIVLWLLALPQNRRWLLRWELYAGGVVAALVVMPTLTWNANHEWVSFVKQFGRVGVSRGFRPELVGEFIGGLIGLISPLIAMFAAIGYAQATKAGVREKSSGHLLIVLTATPLLVYMLMHALRDRVPPNWPGPIYPSLALLAALAIIGVRRTGMAAPRFLRDTAIAAVPLGFVLVGLMYAHAAFPLTAMFGNADPISQLRGWPEMARTAEQLAKEQKAQWIATSNYTTAAVLAYELDRRLPVHQLNERLRYINLGPAPKSSTAGPALYVEYEKRVDLGLLRRRFRIVEPAGSIERRAGEVTLAVYKAYRIAEPIAEPLEPPSVDFARRGR